MNPIDLDRLHAWAEGRLSAAEARAFEAALAADPALAREAEAYREVHRATADLLEGVPESGVTFEGLDLDAAPANVRPATSRRAWAYAAAAAALVVVVTAWVLGGFGRTEGSDAPESANVVLSAIPITTEPLEPPAVLMKGYAPVEKGHVAWLAKEAEAAEVARYAGRSVFVYAHVDECPYCREMDATSFKDPEVQALLARFVPVQVNVLTLPEGQAKALFQGGWPYLAVKRADGTVVRELSGLQDPSALRRSLEAAVAADGAEAPAWPGVVERARRDAAAREGRTALLTAQTSATTDPAAARDQLRRASARLMGSEAGRDLERVLAAWKTDAPFPTLTETPR